MPNWCEGSIRFRGACKDIKEVEILRGELVKDEEIKYEDWEWECPMAYLGG